jgi:hypothetical protein
VIRRALVLGTFQLRASQAPLAGSRRILVIFGRVSVSHHELLTQF